MNMQSDRTIFINWLRVAYLEICKHAAHRIAFVLSVNQLIEKIGSVRAFVRTSKHHK